MTMIGIGSAVHTTNPMHHTLRRSELCNRIHHKHQWEGGDDDALMPVMMMLVALKFIMMMAMLMMMTMMTFMSMIAATNSGVSILRYFSRTLLIIYSHFYKKLGPIYKKLNCETMVTDHRPVRTIMHLTSAYKALKRLLSACTL